MNLNNKARVWAALMLREIETRAPRSLMSYLLILLQPCFQLLMMYLIFSFINRRADFGTSLFLFLFSGVLPYFLFTHVASRLMSAVNRAQPLRPLGVVSAVDVALASLVVELCTIILIGSLVLFVAWCVGLRDAVPYDYGELVLSIVVLSLMAFGVGLCNSALSTFFGAWPLIWGVIAKSLIFFSNIFYVIDFMPTPIRDVLWWNPLLHGIIWFRVGLFRDYPTLTFSPAYILTVTLAAILLGLALERTARKNA